MIPRLGHRVDGATPGTEETLTLLLAGTAERRAASHNRIVALARAADPVQLVVHLTSQRLLPLLGRRFLALAEPDIASPVREQVDAQQARWRQRGLLSELLTTSVCTQLEDAGIPAVSLKGSLMARELYGDPGLRSTSDLDLLVSAENFHRAIEVLTAGGEHEVSDGTAWQRGLPLMETTLPPVKNHLSIDLHWRLHWYESSFAEEALARARNADRPPRLLGPGDLLVALLLFHARDGFWGLRGAADVAAWWDRYSSELPSCGIEPVVTRHPELGPSLLAAAAVADSWTGVPMSALFPTLTAARRTGMSERLADWSGQIPKSRFRATTALVDVILSPRRQRLHAIRRYYMPPAAVVATAYGAVAPSALELFGLRMRYALMIARRFLVDEVRLIWQSLTRPPGRVPFVTDQGRGPRPGAEPSAVVR